MGDPAGRDMEFRKRWGRWLRYFIKAKELDGVTAIARALGVQHPTISNFLNKKPADQATVGFDVMMAIREKWGRTVQELIFDEPPNVPVTREERIAALQREERHLQRLLDETRLQLKGLLDPSEAPELPARPRGQGARGGQS